MNQKFSRQLDKYIRQAGLPLRHVADQSGIPHQTIFNWLKGTQPRWHVALPDDLHRLGTTLGLNDDEITLLLRFAGCFSARPEWLQVLEVPMDSSLRLPKGWFVTGDAPEKYEIGVDPTLIYENQPCVTLIAKPDPAEFAALAQMVKAEAYHGKRLHFSAVVRAADIENRAALFMRVGGPHGEILAFDNMRNRPITGTQAWTRHTIVLDVPKEAENIIFGLLLSLQGQVWMADVNLEVVGPDVPTTDILAEITSYFPVNLGFEE